MPGADVDPRRERGALAAAYATLFFSLGIYMPFFPLWLTAQGMNTEEIGVALAVPLITRLVATPLLGLLSDRIGRPRAVLVGLAGLTCVLIGGLALSRAPMMILLMLGIAAMAWNPSFALLDAYATRQARNGRVDYGRSRLWGSASFVLANLGGGALIASTGAWIVVALMLVGHVSYFLSAFLLPELPRPPACTSLHLEVPRARFVLFGGIAAAALIQASHGTLYAFASLHWAQAGISLGVIGILWAVGVCAEILLFRYGTPLVRRFGPALLLAFGGLCAVVRFVGLSLDPPIEVLFLLQLLHGGTFGATYLGMVELVARNTPESRAGSAQSIASWTVSLALSAASAASGPLWASFGASTFLVSAGLGGAGALLAIASGWSQPQRAGGAGATKAPS